MAKDTASENTADPIIKTLTVPLSPDRAFRLFTEEIADWWPLDSHSLSASDGKPAKSVTITAKKGGPITEIRHDGTKAPWGHVTEWQPGRAFGMAWHVGRPADQATDVHVTFDVVADGTRVTLVHSGWQALATDAVATRKSYHSGWDMILRTHFAPACKTTLILT